MQGLPMLKMFLLFIGPMILSNVLQALSVTINSVYLGQMIGIGAFAGASGLLAPAALLPLLHHEPRHRRRRADRASPQRRRAHTVSRQSPERPCSSR